MQLSKIEWKSEYRLIKELIPSKKNPRLLKKKEAEDIEKSLNRFGLCEPIVINQDNQIIGGHQRVCILKKNKLKEVQVFVPNRMLTQQEVDELNIRLNKNQGEFDFDILANEWEPCDLLEWGFVEEDLIGSLEIPEAEEKPKNPKKKGKTCPNCGHDLNAR